MVFLCIFYPFIQTDSNLSTSKLVRVEREMVEFEDSDESFESEGESSQSQAKKRKQTGKPDFEVMCFWNLPVMLENMNRT